MTQPRDPADLASIKRVLTLHQKYPDKTREELAEQMIRDHCIQVAGRGAVTASAAVLPTLGIIGSLAIGVISNATANQQSQSDLILDIATVHGYAFQPGEKQRYLALALGLTSGQRQPANQSATDQLLAKGGQQLANKAKQRMARASVGRALPVVNVATAAGSNVLMTYAAAQRAKAYIKHGPDSVGDMESDIAALLKSEELKLSEWTQESLAQSMNKLSDTLIEGFDQGAQDVGRAAGRAVRNFRSFWREATKPK